MENAKQLANRFREVLLNGKWIANTNYNDLLSDVNWEQANQKISTLNTIAALCFHINYYLVGILNVFEGGALEISDKYSFDYPPLQFADDWENRKKTLSLNAEKMANHIELLSDQDLDQIFVKEAYGNYRRNMEAVIEHSYYHLGQISLIKKMIQELESK